MLGEGYDVTAVASAEEGLETLKRWRPELLLTDYQLPGQTGGWLVREGRAAGLLDGVPGLDTLLYGGLPRERTTLLMGRSGTFNIAHAVKEQGVLFAPLPGGESLRTHFFQLVSGLRRQRVTSIITAEGEADLGPLTPLGMEDPVCDLVLVLRNRVDGKRRRRTVEVFKYRTSRHFKGEYPWTVGERGLSVFPVDADEAQPESVEKGRYSSGLEGLDNLTGGGLLRDSILLVRGPAGSGKTTLAGMFARAGAARGERVFYYGFEETRPILLRNSEALGLPLGQHVEDGRIKLVCRYPEATSPEDMVVELREVLEKYNPSLIVLDSISSIEHVTSFETFRDFIIGVASSLRRHGRSALLTQTVSDNQEAERSAPYLSTLADSLLMLGYRPRPQGLVRSIRMLKMRGGAHDTAERKLEIRAGGLRVGEPMTD